mgnify:FL=1
MSISEVFNQLLDATLYAKHRRAYEQQVQQTINYRVLSHLKQLYVNPKAIPQVKAEVLAILSSVKSEYQSSKESNEQYIAQEITNFLKNPDEFKPVSSPKIPDGSPIGSYQCTNN